MPEESPSLSRPKPLSLRLENGLLQHRTRARAPQSHRKEPSLGFLNTARKLESIKHEVFTHIEKTPTSVIRIVDGYIFLLRDKDLMHDLGCTIEF